MADDPAALTAPLPDAPPRAAGPAPVPSGERITSIDALRGFALLGILVMNVQMFALSDYSYFDPRVAGGFEGADFAAWLVSHVFFDMKMMTIFSMLFGAGIVLMTGRAERRTGRSGGLHVRRMLALGAIGLAHAYLVWHGDVLVAYAMCGLPIYFARKLPARVLVALGLAVTLVAVPLNAVQGFAFEATRTGAEAAEREIAAAGEDAEPTPAQLAAIEAWEATLGSFSPTPDVLAIERDIYKQGGFELFARRAQSAAWFQTLGMAFWGVWRIGGMMLLGMGLFKLGVFSAALSTRAYVLMAALGYGLGLPIVAFGVWTMIEHGFDVPHLFYSGVQFNYVGSVLVALGHVGLVMLVCRSGALPRVRATLAAVGRMAFTNYLTQSVLATFVFYPWGLGLWGDLSRVQLLLVVAVIWALQLAWSPWWLARFRFGPAEWLWRSITYGVDRAKLRDARERA